MPKSRNDLCVSFGSIEQDSKTWDILFWQNSGTQELFRATAELCRTAEKLRARREKRDEVTSIDRTAITFGSLRA